MNNMSLSPNKDYVVGVYDLKGSTFQRLTPPEKVSKGATRKDLNFIGENQRILLSQQQIKEVLDTL